MGPQYEIYFLLHFWHQEFDGCSYIFVKFVEHTNKSHFSFPAI